MTEEDEKRKLNKKIFKKEELINLKFEFLFELPYWVNLRSGKYKITHKNIFKELIDDSKLEAISYNKNYEDYVITINNLMWKIGFDDFKNIEIEDQRIILIEEDIKNKRIIDEALLDRFFGKKKNEIHRSKLKTVIHKRYIFPITFKEDKSLTLKELVDPFVEPLKKDILKAVNEFLEIYIGYFSTEVFNNDVYILGDSAFSQERVSLKIYLDDKDISSDVKFPFGFYSHPYYPMIFPKIEIQERFFDLLKQKKYPSLAKVMKGISNNYFLHGDVKIGIICLDIALESSISDFIIYYNSKQEDNSKKLNELKKKKTMGRFLKNDLPGVLKSVFGIDDEKYISEIKKFHEERNLIVHRKRRNIDPEIDKYRKTVHDLIDKLENFIQLPKVIDNPNTDFDHLIVGISTETFERGWGEIKLFRSFSELIEYKEERMKKNQKLIQN